MAPATPPDDQALPGVFLEDLDDLVGLSVRVEAVFGRSPDDVDLRRLTRRRDALGWRIAPPRRPATNSRVITRRSQPGGRRAGQAPDPA